MKKKTKKISKVNPIALHLVAKAVNMAKSKQAEEVLYSVEALARMLWGKLWQSKLEKFQVSKTSAVIAIAKNLDAYMESLDIGSLAGYGPTIKRINACKPTMAIFDQVGLDHSAAA